MQWEYKILFVDATRWNASGLPKDLNQGFDELGAQGWELVSVEALNSQGVFGNGSYTRGITAFFKRPKGS